MANKKRKKTGGRKKGEPTEVVRIPKFIRPMVDDLIDQHKKRSVSIKDLRR